MKSIAGDSFAIGPDEINNDTESIALLVDCYPEVTTKEVYNRLNARRDDLAGLLILNEISIYEMDWV